MTFLGVIRLKGGGGKGVCSGLENLSDQLLSGRAGMKALSFVRKVFFVRARYRMLPRPEGVMVSETNVVPALYGRQSPETVIMRWN